MEVMSWGNLYISASSAIYIGGWDGTYIHTSHSIAMNGTTFVFANNGGIYIQWNGSRLSTPNSFSAYYLYTSDGGNGVVQSLNGDLYVRAATGNIRCTDPSNNPGTIFCNNIQLAGNAQLGSQVARGSYTPMSSNGNGDFILGGASSIIYMHPNLTVGIQQTYPTISFFGFTAMSCNGVNTNSARRYKSDIRAIDRALDLVLDPNLNGAHFTYSPPGMVEKGVKKFGFIADDWYEKAPDVVSLDQDGLPSAMDYQQVTAILFQAFKEYVDKTDTKIKELEARLA